MSTPKQQQAPRTMQDVQVQNPATTTDSQATSETRDAVITPSTEAREKLRERVNITLTREWISTYLKENCGLFEAPASALKVALENVDLPPLDKSYMIRTGKKKLKGISKELPEGMEWNPDMPGWAKIIMGYANWCKSKIGIQSRGGGKTETIEDVITPESFTNWLSNTARGEAGYTGDFGENRKLERYELQNFERMWEARRKTRAAKERVEPHQEKARTTVAGIDIPQGFDGIAARVTEIQNGIASANTEALNDPNSFFNQELEKIRNTAAKANTVNNSYIEVVKKYAELRHGNVKLDPIKKVIDDLIPTVKDDTGVAEFKSRMEQFQNKVMQWEALEDASSNLSIPEETRTKILQQAETDPNFSPIDAKNKLAEQADFQKEEEAAHIGEKPGEADQIVATLSSLGDKAAPFKQIGASWILLKLKIKRKLGGILGAFKDFPVVGDWIKDLLKFGENIGTRSAIKRLAEMKGEKDFAKLMGLEMTALGRIVGRYGVSKPTAEVIMQQGVKHFIDTPVTVLSTNPAEQTKLRELKAAVSGFTKDEKRKNLDPNKSLLAVITSKAWTDEVKMPSFKRPTPEPEPAPTGPAKTPDQVLQEMFTQDEVLKGFTTDQAVAIRGMTLKKMIEADGLPTGVDPNNNTFSSFRGSLLGKGAIDITSDTLTVAEFMKAKISAGEVFTFPKAPALASGA